MKRIAYLVVLAAAIATAAIERIAASEPDSSAGLGFLAWGLSPYLYLLFMVRRAATPLTARIALAIAVVASFIGVWLPVDAMFVEPDAQSGLVFLFAPLWQWFLLLVATVPLYFLNRNLPGPARGL